MRSKVIILGLFLMATSCTRQPADADAASAAHDTLTAADQVALADALTPVSDASSDALAGDVSSTDSSGPSVYELMGKKPGIKMFLDVFFKEMAWSPVLNFYLPTADSAQMAQLKIHMTDVLAIIWGCSECGYAGNLDMAAVHKGVLIADGEWNAFTGLCFEVMNEELLLPNETIIAAVKALEVYKGQVVDTTSLYARFGGRTKVRKVVGQLFTKYIQADPQLKARFAGAPQPALADLVTDYIAGPVLGQKYVQYKGKAPATAHAGMKITDAEMAIFLDLLGKAMDDYTVNPQAKGELLALLAKQGQALVGL